MVSVLLGVLWWDGGGVCCCPASECGVVLALLIPVQYSSVLLSCRVLLSASVWCSAGDYLSVVFVWWGVLRLPSPIRGGGWGHCGWWGVCRGGGWHGVEGRQCY